MKEFIDINFENKDLTKIEIFNNIDDLNLNKNITLNNSAFSKEFFSWEETEKIFNTLNIQKNNKNVIFKGTSESIHGKITYIYPYNDIKNLKNISDNFPKKLLQFEEFLFKNFNIYQLTRIQIVDTLKNPQNLETIPFCLHSDRLKFIRVMIYLTNVENDNGPLNILPLNENGLEKINSYKNNFHKKFDNWQSLPYKIDTKLKCLSLEGPIGSVILWNGNIPHKAGKLYNNKVRKVIILEYEDKDQYTWRINNNIISNKDF